MREVEHGNQATQDYKAHQRCLEYGTDGALAGVRGRGPLYVSAEEPWQVPVPGGSESREHSTREDR